MFNRLKRSEKNKDRLTRLKGHLREEFISAQTGFLAGLAMPLIVTPYLAVNIAIGIFTVNTISRLNLIPRLTGALLGLVTATGVNIYQGLERQGLIDDILERIEESNEPEGIMVRQDHMQQQPLRLSLTIPKSTIT